MDLSQHKNIRILQIKIFFHLKKTEIYLSRSQKNEFAKAFNTQSKEEILSSLNKTNDELSKIEMILSSVVKRREDEALARI